MLNKRLIVLQSEPSSASQSQTIDYSEKELTRGVIFERLRGSAVHVSREESDVFFPSGVIYISTSKADIHMDVNAPGALQGNSTFVRVRFV